jgi:16S rRNA (guanine527-N7)-methyltransferase
MDLQRIAALLEPFISAQPSSFVAGCLPGEPSRLTAAQLEQISSYLDMLLRWNSRINLTSVRAPEEIVTRHLGESLFAARNLFPSHELGAELLMPPQPQLFDFGSGAGFPGLPIKIWAPQIEVTLIESNQKKATFLREVIRRLGLKSAAVFSGRAENLPKQADTVTMRAVEQFETSVRVASGMVEPLGSLALLIGEAQVMPARKLAPNFQWQEPLHIPLSLNRVLLIGQSSPPVTNQVS